MEIMVSLVDCQEYHLKKGNFYEILAKSSGILSYRGDDDKIWAASITSFANVDLPLNNSLNRKLYPDRVEYNGQLLPKKLVDRIKENL